MIVHRLKFKTCQVLQVYWIFVGFNKFLWVLFFWVTLYLTIWHPAFASNKSVETTAFNCSDDF